MLKNYILKIIRRAGKSPYVALLVGVTMFAGGMAEIIESAITLEEGLRSHHGVCLAGLWVAIKGISESLESADYFEKL